MWALVFVFITIFPLIKPEKQLSGMAENISIHFLVFLSMEESAGEGRAGAGPGVDVPPPPVHQWHNPSDIGLSQLFSLPLTYHSKQEAVGDVWEVRCPVKE